MLTTSRLWCGAATCLLIGAAVADQPAPLYQPRFADAPPARVGQASRSAGADLQLVVLAPDRKGATADPTPRLAWYLSAASEKPLEIVVQERGANAPLFEQRLESAGEAGFHSLDLGDVGVELKAGQEYEWSVALVNDPARRASDAFSKGVVQYVPSPSPPATGPAESIAAEYLRRGYWYDAIGLMLETLERAPDDAGMVALRQQVLESEQLLVRP